MVAALWTLLAIVLSLVTYFAIELYSLRNSLRAANEQLVGMRENDRAAFEHLLDQLGYVQSGRNIEKDNLAYSFALVNQINEVKNCAQLAQDSNIHNRKSYARLMDHLGLEEVTNPTETVIQKVKK
jgi:hypothetical protein